MALMICQPGRRYSDLAIETALILRLLYHLPLRQAEGFLHSLFGMMRLDFSAPDYTTLSHCSQHRTKLLTLREVMQMTALSRSAVYAPKDTVWFPPLIRIGRRAVR